MDLFNSSPSTQKLLQWLNWFMDIDLLWALGGFIIIPSPETETLMAAAEQSLWRSNVLLCCFLFCLFLLPVLAQTTDQLKLSMASSSSSRRLLLPSTSQFMKPHPKNSNSTSEFKESKHEVPSGPNPVSNR